MSQIASADTDAVESELADKSPGQGLREGRERRKLSVEQVARDLNLTVATIEALEKDQFERLPGPVFARGYLRSYAKLLDLPAEPFLDAMGGGVVEPPAISITPVRKSVPLTRNYSPIKGIVSTLAVLSILTGVGWWAWDHWYQQGAGAADLLDAAGESFSADAWPEGGMVNAVADDQVPDPKQVPVALGDLPEPSANTLTPAPAPAPAEEDNSIDSLLETYSRTPEPAASTVELVESTSAAEADSADGALPSGPVSEEPEALDSGLTVAGNDESESILAFRFSEDSWVEVRDAQSSRRLTGLMKAGTVRKVDGRPPFTVTVGNSRGTVVILNGEEFDHTRFNRGNVSRFTVGGG